MKIIVEEKEELILLPGQRGIDMIKNSIDFQNKLLHTFALLTDSALKFKFFLSFYMIAIGIGQLRKLRHFGYKDKKDYISVFLFWCVGAALIMPIITPYAVDLIAYLYHLLFG